MPLNDLSLSSTNTVLIVVDMQKGFLLDGAPLKVDKGMTMVPRIVSLLEHLKSKKVLTIWTRVALDNSQAGVYRLLKPHLFADDGAPLIGRDTDFFQIIDELLPLIEDRDIVIDKDRYSAFYQTNLDLLLRQMGIRNLIFCGITTNICVESTVRDAFQMDYVPLVLSDCTMSFSTELHEFSLEVISHSFGFVLTRQECQSLLE